MAAPTFIHNPLPCGGGVGGWVVLGGRRKNKKEEGNAIEEVFKTGSEKDEIKKIYRVYSLNSFY
jgi:hypothetical protein